jgi:hypothetical protein
MPHSRHRRADAPTDRCNRDLHRSKPTARYWWRRIGCVRRRGTDRRRVQSFRRVSDGEFVGKGLSGFRISRKGVAPNTWSARTCSWHTLRDLFRLKGQRRPLRRSCYNTSADCCADFDARATILCRRPCARQIRQRLAWKPFFVRGFTMTIKDRTVWLSAPVSRPAPPRCCRASIPGWRSSVRNRRTRGRSARTPSACRARRERNGRGRRARSP